MRKILILGAVLIGFSIPVTAKAWLAQLGTSSPPPTTSTVWTDYGSHLNTTTSTVWTDYGSHLE